MVRAEPDDLSDLKLAIAKKLVSAYRAPKAIYPGMPKHPGRKIYNEIADQV